MKKLVAKRYVLNLNGSGRNVIAIGYQDELDSYITEKFGVRSIISGELLDGLPLIEGPMSGQEESIMLNAIVYG